jgi:hypothetical protein
LIKKIALRRKRLKTGGTSWHAGWKPMIIRDLETELGFQLAVLRDNVKKRRIKKHRQLTVNNLQNGT